MADVFIKVGDLVREKLEVGKILQGLGFEPATLGIVSAVTDCSAISDTGSEGCCWLLMGVVKIYGVGFWCFLVWLV